MANMTQNLLSLKVKIFADGANLVDIKNMNENSLIQGLTTNPSLMKKAGVVDYRRFGLEVLKIVDQKPISFEVFADTMEEMETQATEINSWGKNVYVKIPITNSKGVSTKKIIKKLTNEGVKVNVTAVMTAEQVSEISTFLNPDVPSYVSIFAGRIADTGLNPIPILKDSIAVLKFNKKAEIIWASPRELLNIFQADEIGCHAITATTDILNKINLIGKDLNEYSLETV
jgi:transaldolase